MLWFMGSQRARHDQATELTWLPQRQAQKQRDHQKPSDSGLELDGGRGAIKGAEVEVVGQDFMHHRGLATQAGLGKQRGCSS